MNMNMNIGSSICTQKNLQFNRHMVNETIKFVLHLFINGNDEITQ